MTTNIQNASARHTTDVEFRTWGSAISAALQACGLVKTSDTGQIDWTTVVRPGVSTFAGYEVYRFNDSYQATRPVFFKIEYGTGTTTSTPRIQITIGSGSNGSGTITGTNTLTVSALIGAGITPTATSYPILACHADGYFLLRAWDGNATASCNTLFMLERMRDDDGAIVDDGLVCLYSDSNVTTTLQIYYYDTLSWVSGGTNAGFQWTTYPSASSLIVGTSVLTFPYCYLTKTASRPLYRSIGVLCCGSSDFALSTNATIQRYDGPHTYRRVDSAPSTSSLPNARLLVRWE